MQARANQQRPTHTLSTNLSNSFTQLLVTHTNHIPHPSPAALEIHFAPAPPIATSPLCSLARRPQPDPRTPNELRPAQHQPDSALLPLTWLPPDSTSRRACSVHAGRMTHECAGRPRRNTHQPRPEYRFHSVHVPACVPVSYTCEGCLLYRTVHCTVLPYTRTCMYVVHPYDCTGCQRTDDSTDTA